MSQQKNTNKTQEADKHTMNTSDNSTDKDDIQRIIDNAQLVHQELSSLIADMENDDFWTAPYEGEQDKYAK